MEKKFEAREVKKFGRMLSSDFNEMNKEISHDLFELRENLMEDEAKFQNILSEIKNENIYFQNKISDIAESINNIDSNILYADFYDDNYIHYGDDYSWKIDTLDRAEVYHNYSAILPITHTKVPKSYLYKANKEAFVPDDININITNNEVPDEVVKVNQTSPRNALDQNINTVWYKKFLYDEDRNIDKVSVDYQIDLPQTVFTNMHSDCIMINTYPDFACDIENIKYKTAVASDYRSFPEDNIKTDASNNKLLVFEEMDITSFIITFFSDKSIITDSGQTQSFIVGAKNIAVYNMRFDEGGKIYVEFNTEGIEQITDVEIGVFNKEQTNGLDYTLYGIGNLSDKLNQIEENEYISTNYNNDIIVELSFEEADIVPPVVKYIKLEYQ